MVEKGSLRLHLPSWYLYLELQTPVPLVSISVDAIVLKNTCKCQHGLYLLCQSERMREWDFFFFFFAFGGHIQGNTEADSPAVLFCSSDASMM